MTTWNPADKSATVTLSGGNLTASSATAVSQSVRSTTSKSAGKAFWEVTLGSLTSDIAVGIATASEGLAPGGGLGADPNGLGFYAVSPAQAIYINSVSLSNGATASAAGAVVSFALDATAKLIWISTAVMRAAATPWNNSATANPATGVGGISLSTLGAAPWFAMFNDDLGGAAATANFGASAFNQAIPSGFAAWDGKSLSQAITSVSTTATTLHRGRRLSQAIASVSVQASGIGRSRQTLSQAISSTSQVSASLRRSRRLTASLVTTSQMTAILAKTSPSGGGARSFLTEMD